MPQYDVPRDIFMDDWHDVDGRGRCCNHQPLEDGNPDCAEPDLVSEAKTDVECPLPGYGPKGLQDYLCCIGDRIVARQLADTRAVDLSHWW